MLAWLLLPATLHAGGGPENVLLAVNARSWASMTIANHYIALRNIPANNVIWIDWQHDVDTIDLATFRSDLLQPITETIKSRRLSSQIDYIVYSSDFPWSVGAKEQVGGTSLPKHLTPVCSLNSVTYFAEAVASGGLDFFSLDANHYFLPPTSTGGIAPSRGFRSWYGWGPEGRLLEAGGDRYFLSVMLGVTSGRGMSAQAVVDYLTRSAGADNTHPQGTIYFMKSGDVRSQTRMPGFATAADTLLRMGVSAEVLSGDIPVGRNDVQGAMLGSAAYSWGSSKSIIRRGAICESLTSTGGVMHQRGSQTPLTDALANGAAGSSGTVVEPYAIQQKFPVPAIHVHYARGCSLAEAFYQSVHGPFQLLIVGDPLCQPWAHVPEVSVEGITADETVTGTLTLTPSAQPSADHAVDQFELFVDGVRVDRCRPGETFTVNSTSLSDGWHELRVVAIESSSIESQGRVVIPFTSSNYDKLITFTASASGKVRWGEPLEFSVEAPGALGTVILAGNLGVARIAGPQGSVTIDPQRLGMGPVSLRAVALGNSGAASNAVSPNIELEVLPPGPLAGSPVRVGIETAPGLLLTTADGQRAIVTDTEPANWLTAAGVKAGEAFTLTGRYDNRRSEMHQFQVQHAGKLSIEIGGQKIYEEDFPEPQRRWVPVQLGEGIHEVKITGEAGTPPRLELRFGSSGVHHFNQHTFRHRTDAGNAE